jgi:DNA-binding response OmpR family regulator
MAVQPAESAFAAGDEGLRFGNLDIYPSEFQVFADGRRVGLTVKEFETFMVLAARPDRVVRRAEIYERVWNRPMRPQDRSVDVFVKKVRQKLGRSAPDWTYIHTHFGVGYRFLPERSAPTRA